jgi:hypothetical protein
MGQMLQVLVEAERCAIRTYTEICNMTFGKDHRTCQPRRAQVVRSSQWRGALEKQAEEELEQKAANATRARVTAGKVAADVRRPDNDRSTHCIHVPFSLFRAQKRRQNQKLSKVNIGKIRRNLEG